MTELRDANRVLHDTFGGEMGESPIQFGHSRRDEVDGWYLDIARQRVAKRDPEPQEPERWGPVKIGVVVVFMVAFIVVMGLMAGISEVPA